MIFKKPSVLRNLLLTFLALGLVIGLVFPVFAGFFVEWQTGMRVWFSVASLVAGGTIGVLNYWVVKVVLLRRLARISEVATAISQNDISHDCGMVSDDMIGDIVTSFNRMAENLRNVVGQISSSTGRLHEAAEQMSAVTAETKRGVMRQQTETDQVATAMNEMTATLQEVAQSAAATADAAKQANDASHGGKGVVGEAIDAIDRVASEVEKTAEVIQRLEQDTVGIGTVLDVIRGIAEQTNLLALNAAIEAARAGEQGRGFAVVADEVRTLASKTQQSTQEIQAMIEKLQGGARNAVEVMEKGRNQAKTSVERAASAGTSLESIAEAVQTITEMSTQIANAVEQQGSVAEEINRNIVTITEVAEQTAEGSRQTERSSEELGHLAAELRSMVGVFKTSTAP